MGIRNPYLETSINTSTPGRLVIMLYDGLIRFINTANTAIQEKQYDMASNNLKYAQDIVLNLRESLEESIYPELYRNLYPLYDFWYQKLVDANVNKSCEIIEEILPMIIQLRDAWKEAELQVTKERQGNNL